jgi:hypothetical protein
MTLSDMSDSLFTTPLIEMHVYYIDGLRWLINDDDEHDYIMMLIYFIVMFVSWMF